MKKFYILIIALLAINSALAQGCLPEGILFASQAQIDNFQTDYPGCTEIEGDVDIQGNDIIHLDGLSNIILIDGHLDIIECDSLISIEGLGKLTTIGNHLNIANNEALKSLVGLDNLSSIGDYLTIEKNTALTDLMGLYSLKNIGDGLLIFFNSDLIDLSGLDNLLSVSDVRIVKNKRLKNLNGLENLTSLEGELAIEYNDSLISLNGLENLTSIGNSLWIDKNISLTSLSSLKNLNSIGTLFIGMNYALTNLNGLESLTKVAGELDIYENNNLVNVNGIENLNSIGFDIKIISNLVLRNLDGFKGLTSVGRYITVSGNDSLISLKGLENIEGGFITGLEIYNNYSLSICEAQSICEYLTNQNGIIEIYNNSLGCNSQQEIIEICKLGIDDIIIQNNFSIFPNPSSSRFTIQFSLENEEQVKLLVLNNLGQVVAIVANETLSEGQHELNWNAVGMPAGVYFYNIQIGNQAGTGKMVLMK